MPYPQHGSCTTDTVMPGTSASPWRVSALSCAASPLASAPAPRFQPKSRHARASSGVTWACGSTITTCLQPWQPYTQAYMHHARIHTRIYTRIHTRMHTCTLQSYMQAYLQSYMQTYIHAYIQVYDDHTFNHMVIIHAYIQA